MILAISSLPFILPSRLVFASSSDPTQEQYDRIYNYLVSGSSEPLHLDNTYANKRFNFELNIGLTSGIYVEKVQTNAYIFSFDYTGGSSSTIPKSDAFTVDNRFTTVGFSFNTIGSNGLDFIFKPTVNDRNVLISYLPLSQQTHRPGSGSGSP